MKKTKIDAADMSGPHVEPIPTATVDELQLLLFGADADPKDVDRWLQQGFEFCKKPELSFGLSQLYGGPCGILAPLQAYIIHDLVFSEHSVIPQEEQKGAPLSGITVEQREDALARVLTRCIVQAARSQDEPQPLRVVTGEYPEALQCATFGDEGELLQYIKDNLDSQFHRDAGVFLYVYSVLLSRGVSRIRADMDDMSAPLVGRFGHCSQELVNLMICGHAVTNVHDNDKNLGAENDASAFILHGIPCQSDVGFLTLLEALHYGQVGDFYKQPKFPIWVVGSSSHYTVMFATDPRVGRMSKHSAAVKQWRSIFLEYDPHENGFVEIHHLGTIATKCSRPESPEELQRKLDPQNMGIVLWGDFLSFMMVCCFVLWFGV